MARKIHRHVMAICKGESIRYVALQHSKSHPSEPDPPLGSRGMSLSKVLALSSQPCKHSTGCPSGDPQALAAKRPQGTGNFTSENMPKIKCSQAMSPVSHVLETGPRELVNGPELSEKSNTGL